MMLKFLILCGICLSLSACDTHDEQYYKLHPVALREALSHCPQTSPKLLTCPQLQNIAARVDALALALRIDAQAYGKQILALQEKIASQSLKLKQDPKQKELQSSLHADTQDLQERLAIVRWLESPEG